MRIRCAAFWRRINVCVAAGCMHYELIPQVKDKKPQRPPAASDLQDTGKAAGSITVLSQGVNMNNIRILPFKSPYSVSVWTQRPPPESALIPLISYVVVFSLYFSSFIMKFVAKILLLKWSESFFMARLDIILSLLNRKARNPVFRIESGSGSRLLLKRQRKFIKSKTVIQFGSS